MDAAARTWPSRHPIRHDAGGDIRTNPQADGNAYAYAEAGAEAGVDADGGAPQRRCQYRDAGAAPSLPTRVNGPGRRRTRTGPQMGGPS